MKFIELFAGIGGFRYGLEKANNKNRECWQEKQSSELRCSISKGNISNVKSRDESSNANSINFRCIWANEIDKYVCQIYRKKFGEKELYEGDIRKITTESIPNHDLLTAGFPCQSFSIAGKRKGFGDTRGTLFFEICRIVEAKKPNLLLLENVKGLLNHDGGNTFRIILNSLSELGYDCEWEVLNSKNFGIPQNRERVFIVGHLRGKGGQKVFPIGEGSETIVELQGQQIGAITARRGSAKSDGDYIIKGNRKALQIPTNTKLGYDIAEERKDGIRLQYENSKTARGRVIKGNIQALQGGGQVGVLDNAKIRRLTPTECERLQGFPDGWTKGISDTQRYKCLGNAVTTNVITEIGKKIILNKKREG